MALEEIKAKIKAMSQDERKELAAFLAVCFRVEDSAYTSRLAQSLDGDKRLLGESAEAFVARHEKMLAATR